MKSESPMTPNPNRIAKGWVILASAPLLFLQACVTNPITTDSLPQLKPGEGIAGISFDSVVELRSIQFDADSGNGARLRIPDVPLGQSVFLFVVPAGRYCIQSYSLAQNGINLSSTPSDRCFDVEAGKLSYSGTFVPSFEKSELLSGMHHLNGTLTKQDHSQAFLDALNQNYPHIRATVFPSSSDRSP